MFASLKTHTQILGRRALPARLHGLAVCGVGILLATQLTACGQKGPLFLPPGQAVPAAPALPVPALAPAPKPAASALQIGPAPTAQPGLPASAP